MKASLLSCLVAATAFAQLGSNPECLGSICTHPPIPRTATFPASWSAGYLNETQTLGYIDDADGDGRADAEDNCPFATNRDQFDSDGDGVGEACDNCNRSNFNQLDGDGDGMGDTCDTDRDGDGVDNSNDLCPSIPNPDVGGGQPNVDGDGLGDPCDADLDGDGFDNLTDLCPLIASATNVAQPGQQCSHDTDGDGVPNHLDNCPGVPNPNNQDVDRDGLGDACDLDIDGDGLNDKLASLQPSSADNCPTVANHTQRDGDLDGIGDACDARFCLVVDLTAPTDCLDPNGAFRVHAGGLVTIRIGQPLRLPLFANRNGVAIDFSWRVLTRPAGSQVAITAATGWANASRDFQYAYPFGAVPTVTFNVPGRYVLELQARLVFPDEQHPTASQSLSQLIVDAI
ncbi:MAG: thrombospondin type 3 repeat-containing protein [Myxococcaceae bacterium]